MARSTTFLTRLMLFLHRILGTALCLLFAVWFLSGLVMIYHTFPRVTQAERIARQNGLEPDSLPSLASLLRRQLFFSCRKPDRAENQTEFPAKLEENPIEVIRKIWKMGVLGLVIKNTEVISQQILEKSKGTGGSLLQ